MSDLQDWVDADVAPLRETLEQMDQQLQPGVMVMPTTYDISVFPPGHRAYSAYLIQVEHRGNGLWAVTRMRFCLDRDGEWSYEALPSGREDEWLATHRFDFGTAINLAVAAARTVLTNGKTAEQVLAEEQDAKDR